MKRITLNLQMKNVGWVNTHLMDVFSDNQPLLDGITDLIREHLVQPTMASDFAENVLDSSITIQQFNGEES